MRPPPPPASPFYSEIELRVVPDAAGGGGGGGGLRERTVVVRRTRPVQREAPAPDAARFRKHLAETGFWLQAQPGDVVDKDRLDDELGRHASRRSPNLPSLFYALSATASISASPCPLVHRSAIAVPLSPPLFRPSPIPLLRSPFMPFAAGGDSSSGASWIARHSLPPGLAAA
jgi:hypothetical protein